jgi:hypothetical protein
MLCISEEWIGALLRWRIIDRSLHISPSLHLTEYVNNSGTLGLQIQIE